MDDFEAITIPGAPAKYLGPTGKVFIHNGRFSTHLNTVVGSDDEGYRFIPMLVPGQKDVGKLLKGEKATEEQYRIAIEDSKKRKYPAFKSVDEALAAEHAWHQEAEQNLFPAIAPYLESAAGVQ